jgi:hypothetical protein
MGIAYGRKIKVGHASNPEVIIRIMGEVQRVLSGIVGLGTDSEEFIPEVKVQMQPDPEGNLAIIGWIGREAKEGSPDPNYDSDVEVIPPVLTPEETEAMSPIGQERPPFPIAQ